MCYQYTHYLYQHSVKKIGVFRMMKKLIVLSCLMSVLATQSFAATATFKVLKNDPREYGEESVQIQTNKGRLAIYAVNMSPQMYRTFAALKKNQCVSIRIDGKFEKHDGYYSLDDVKQAKKVKCA